MATPYEKGRIVGSYEVIAYLGRRLNCLKQYESVYRVRCTSCQKVQDMTSYDMRRPTSCECQKPENVRGIVRKWSRMRGVMEHVDNSDKLWMSDGEIRRHYNSLADKVEGITILAQLNGVDEKTIRQILHEQKLKEAKNEF
ncbi:MAG: hypothetical protein IJX76_04990 [Clostridia bacterium]|nr:hypothetical protein [Clostridia bacterium]